MKFKIIFLVLGLLVASLSAQTEPARTDSDYLSESFQLLFPSAPASLKFSEGGQPIFPSDTPGFDLLSLGVFSNVLTKTLTLELGGGIEGRIFAKPAWLFPLPARFINPKGSGRLQVLVQARQDAGQGAGLLPGQTNWGRLLVSLNGTLFNYAVPLIVPASPQINRESADKVFGLYRAIAARLDAQGDLDAFIGSPAYPNGSQFALGLTVDYLDSYKERLNETEFVSRVAETLAQKDYNKDGWWGFKPEDIVIGAPGWVLGKKVK